MKKTMQKEMDFDEMRERRIQLVTYVKDEDTWGIEYSTLVNTDTDEILGGALLSFFDTICEDEDGERVFMKALEIFMSDRKTIESFRKD